MAELKRGERHKASFGHVIREKFGHAARRVGHHFENTFSTESSPLALKHFLAELDTKMTALDTNWNEACDPAVNKLDTSEPAKPFLYHTGHFLADGAARDWKGRALKLRLGLLSALLTQPNATIYYWTDLQGAQDAEPLKGAMQGIVSQPELKARLRFRVFDAEAEVSRAVPKSAEHALRLYRDEKMQQPTRSDMMRYVVLNNYGGLWADGDVVMLRDATPLLGDDDWAYMGQKSFINNAVLWASRPASPLVGALLAGIVAKATVDDDTFQFGPTMLKNLHEQEPGGVFHVLPTCFFDGAWARIPGAVSWDDFFGRKATEEETAYLDPAGSKTTPFAYHWHGRWNRDVASGSAAERLERLFQKWLGLQH